MLLVVPTGAAVDVFAAKAEGASLISELGTFAYSQGQAVRAAVLVALAGWLRPALRRAGLSRRVAKL